MDIKKYLKPLLNLYTVNLTEDKYNPSFYRRLNSINICVNPYFHEITSLSVDEKIHFFHEAALRTNHLLDYVTSRNSYFFKYMIVSIFEPLFFKPNLNCNPQQSQFKQLSLFDSMSEQYNPREYVPDREFILKLQDTLKPKLYTRTYRIVLNSVILPFLLSNKPLLLEVNDILLTSSNYSIDYISPIISILEPFKERELLQNVLKSLADHYKDFSIQGRNDSLYPAALKNLLSMRKIIKCVLKFNIQALDPIWYLIADNSYLVMKYLHQDSIELALEYARRFCYFITNENPVVYNDFYIDQLLEILVFLYKHDIPITEVFNTIESRKKFRAYIDRLTSLYSNPEGVLIGLITNKKTDFSKYEGQINIETLSKQAFFTISVLNTNHWKILFNHFDKNSKSLPWFMLYNQQAQFHKSTIAEYRKLLQRTVQLKTPYYKWSECRSDIAKSYITKIPLLNPAILPAGITFYNELIEKTDMFEFSPEVYDAIVKKLTPYTIADPERYKELLKNIQVTQNSATAA